MQKILILIPFLFSLALLPACNTTPQEAAFESESAVQVSVDVAMTAWGDYVKQFHPSDQARAQVKAAYEKYQACAVAVIDATKLVASLASSTNSPAGAISDANEKNMAAEAAAAQALADLVALVRHFGAKI